jgi:4a-hydroxytetrahydrobiopterin dehydratase
MPYAQPLTDAEIAEAIAGLDGWEREGDEIIRKLAVDGFTAAIALVNAVAEAAEAANHHPDIEVQRYRHVTFRLSTHAANAITRRDIDLAAEIDGLARRIGRPATT